MVVCLGGLFHFTYPQATTNAQRFYWVRSLQDF
jgi:hypothetical protein